MSFSSRSSQSVSLIIPDDHKYIVPKRIIKIPLDVALWEKSQAYAEYLEFILSLNEAVKGKALSADCQISQNVQYIIDMLDKFEKNIDIIKPYGESHKFGSLAFKAWYDIMNSETLEILQQSLPTQYQTALAEIHIYFTQAFGNPAKADYGLGHEISFIMFLYCLFKTGIFVDEDKLAAVIRVFHKYIEVVRKLQQSYTMKPADNPNVWCLDDYQFIPYIWGSAQLIDHPSLEPNCFLNKEHLNQHSQDYMFLSCIEYINNTKNGCFEEHSSQLWSIGHIHTWSKINLGLINMYREQVLNKFPVIQHILFGSLLSFQPKKRLIFQQ